MVSREITTKWRRKRVFDFLFICQNLRFLFSTAYLFGGGKVIVPLDLGLSALKFRPEPLKSIQEFCFPRVGSFLTKLLHNHRIKGDGQSQRFSRCLCGTFLALNIVLSKASHATLFFGGCFKMLSPNLCRHRDRPRRLGEAYLAARWARPSDRLTFGGREWGSIKRMTISGGKRTS